MGPRASLDILDKTKTSYKRQETKPKSPSTQTSHYVIYNESLPFLLMH